MEFQVDAWGTRSVITQTPACNPEERGLGSCFSSPGLTLPAISGGKPILFFSLSFLSFSFHSLLDPLLAKSIKEKTSPSQTAHRQSGCVTERRRRGERERRDEFNPAVMYSRAAIQRHTHTEAERHILGQPDVTAHTRLDRHLGS